MEDVQQTHFPTSCSIEADFSLLVLHRQKAAEREWKTSSGTASPMPASNGHMGGGTHAFGVVGQAAGHSHPQGLYGVPPLQTPGFTSGSSDVIEELLKEMANSHSGQDLLSAESSALKMLRRQHISESIAADWISFRLADGLD